MNMKGRTWGTVVASIFFFLAATQSEASSGFQKFECTIGAGTVDGHGCSHTLVIEKDHDNLYSLSFLENGEVTETMSDLECRIADGTGNIECGCLKLTRKVWYQGTEDEHEEYTIGSDDPSCGWNREIRAPDGHNLKYWRRCVFTE